MTGVEVGWTAGRDWGGKRRREAERIGREDGDSESGWNMVMLLGGRFCGQDQRRSDVDLRSLFGRVMWWTEGL